MIPPKYTIEEWAEKFRTLTPEDLAKAQAFPARYMNVYIHGPEHAEEAVISEATRRRIEEGCRRFLQPSQGKSWAALIGLAKPRIRLRMVVKAGVHAGYQQLNSDNTIHSYTWF